MTTPLAQTATVAPINSLSPSRAADFMACPLRYRYRVLDRLPEPPSVAAVRGTVVHAVLENLFLVPGEQRSLEYACSLLPALWQQIVRSEPQVGTLMADPPPALPSDVPQLPLDLPAAPPASEPVTTAAEFFASCEELLARYFSLEDPTRLEPAQRELYVSTTLDSGLQLRGIIDRLDVSPTGAMRVVDYKTGRAPGEGFEAGAMFQMRFYALVLWRIHQAVPHMLQMLYLGSGLVLRYEPDQADLMATQRKLNALWQAIVRAYESQDWRPRTSALCQMCTFRESLCPAWGGVAPPVPVTASERPEPPVVDPADQRPS